MSKEKLEAIRERKVKEAEAFFKKYGVETRDFCLEHQQDSSDSYKTVQLSNNTNSMICF